MDALAPAARLQVNPQLADGAEGLACADEQNRLLAGSRLAIGQLEEIENLIRGGAIPFYTGRPYVSGVAETVGYHIDWIKALLDFPANGSFGIANPRVPIAGRRSYEVQKVLDKALAMHRDPNPIFRGVDYDGLLIRATNDPVVPVAQVRETA